MEIQKDDNAEEFSRADTSEVKCPENIIWKEEKRMGLDYVINEIESKFYFENNKLCTRYDFKSVCVYLSTR